MKLALAQIIADPHAQPRASMEMDTVKEYAGDMKRGDAFPPCTVFYDGKKYWLADGFHRAFAAPSAGISEIECDVRKGTKDDAIWFSCGANQTHGFRRTNEDKRRAGMRLLTHPKFKHKTQEQIAEQCGVTHQFISKLIKELAEVNATIALENEDEGEPSDRMPPHRPGAAEAKLDGASIAKSLHEIERHMDMMPDPHDVVANLPEGDWYRFPLDKIEEMTNWWKRLETAWRARLAAKAAAE